MVGHERDSFMDLERHRLALEQNVAKLRASLQHWQAWEIEYEGLKEDILRLGDKFDQADLVINTLALEELFCKLTCVTIGRFG